MSSALKSKRQRRFKRKNKQKQRTKSLISYFLRCVLLFGLLCVLHFVWKVSVTPKSRLSDEVSRVWADIARPTNVKYNCTATDRFAGAKRSDHARARIHSHRRRMSSGMKYATSSAVPQIRAADISNGCSFWRSDESLQPPVDVQRNAIKRAKHSAHTRPYCHSCSFRPAVAQ